MEVRRIVGLRNHWLHLPKRVEWVEAPVPDQPKRPATPLEDNREGAHETDGDEPLQRSAYGESADIATAALHKFPALTGRG